MPDGMPAKLNSTPKCNGSPGGKPSSRYAIFERLLARFERHALGDPHRPIADAAVARELHLHAVRIAAQACFERRRDEVAQFLVFAAADGIRASHRRVEMVDQDSCGDSDRTAAADRDRPA